MRETGNLSFRLSFGKEDEDSETIGRDHSYPQATVMSFFPALLAQSMLPSECKNSDIIIKLLCHNLLGTNHSQMEE